MTPHRPGRRASALRLTALLVLAAIGCLLSPWLLRPAASAAAGAVFTVNSVLDTPDANTSDGLCNDGAGRCTLRAAIQQANATAGADTINFHIATGVQTIVLDSTLPDVSDPAVIDGSTQPGYAGTPLVEILGKENVLPPISWGLHITAGSSTVRALAIGRVSVTGILLGGAGSGGVGGNKVEACYFGLRADGVTKVEAAGSGCISIVDSSNNIVGGTSAAARNVLSGGGIGVDLAGPDAKGNVVSGNYIGTNAAGTAAVPNQAGVTLRNGASDNTIGGTSAGAGNLISGNTAAGISAFAANVRTAGNRIQGNIIGLAADGQTQLANGSDGVSISDATNYLVGGDTPGARNVISGNNGNGVLISLGSGHTVAGNYIGTNATGTAARGNSGDGVIIVNSQNNVVGGDTAAARNVISGNVDGVEIAGDAGPGVAAANNNVVKGNYIGTNATGTAAVGNVLNGVRAGGLNTTVGGLTATPGAAPGNLISGQQFTNLFIVGSGAVVQGNLIGPEVTGMGRLLNDNTTGVSCWAANALIGGTAAGARNVISGHGTGVSFANSGSGVVQGNYIGTNIDGTAAIINTGSGVEVSTQNVQVGGTAPGAGNLISGNRIGVWLRSGGATVQGNRIGTDASGSAALPNTADGVFISFAFSGLGSVIGGPPTLAANTVAFNLGNGIAVGGAVSASQFSARNTLRANSVHSNGGLGIDLVAFTFPPQGGLGDNDGVTPNDPSDADVGSNNLQNAPVVTSVVFENGAASFQGRLDSAPNQTYTVDLYASAACDPSGHGEGQVYLGPVSATTDAAGTAAFSATMVVPPSAGTVYTATATDASGSTSEFSVCYEMGAPGSARFTGASYAVQEGGGQVTVLVTRTLGTAGAAGVSYATADGTATAGEDYTPANGTLSFAPGETTKSFTVPILNDVLDEGEETFQLTLSNPTGGITLGASSSAAVNITDNDPFPSLSISDVTVAEGDAGTTTPAVFDVRLSEPSGRVVTVDYRADGATASAPVDFQLASGTLVFNPGETFKQVAVVVNGDAEPESDELFFLRFFNAVNATLPEGVFNAFDASGIIWDDDSPGVHFSAPGYAVNETDGSATIKVVRRGDASSAVSASYVASGNASDFSGIASHRRDFTYASGTLDFAPGETEKTFTVLVNDDAFVEEPERIFLNLVPGDGPVEPENLLSANLVVTSDDVQPPTPANNPLGVTEFFVRQHYHDFLNREPDAGGLAFWTGEIEQCGTNAQCREVRRVSVSQAFFLSIEFQTTGYRVFRFYRASFPDGFERPRGMPLFFEFLRDTQQIGRGVVVGQGPWEEQLRQNAAAFARAWVAREDFVAEFPAGMTAAQFVDKLFTNSGVTPTTAERDEALAAYGAGGTEGRAAALLSVTNAGSVFNKQYNPAFVYMQYVGYLRRAPNEDPDFGFGGFDFWLSKLDSFTLPGEDARDETVAVRRVQRAEMVKAFITSTEYRLRFGQ
ncbi:MAG TPA: Calx-beta domain-containing protein [Pyrinomonadaceae bacterium]